MELDARKAAAGWVAIDGERGERVVVDGLNMPIDVTVDADGSSWVLEFARFEEGASCFTGEGYLAGTGRLSVVAGDRLIPVVENLSYPGAVVAADDGSMYVTEIFAGQVLRLDPADGRDTADRSTQAVSPSRSSFWRQK